MERRTRIGGLGEVDIVRRTGLVEEDLVRRTWRERLERRTRICMRTW